MEQHLEQHRTIKTQGQGFGVAMVHCSTPVIAGAGSNGALSVANPTLILLNTVSCPLTLNTLFLPCVLLTTRFCFGGSLIHQSIR
jgi:hypothetical protein